MRKAALATCLIALASTAGAADMSVMVDRSERGVEIFIKLDTERTEELLAPFPDDFVGGDGLVDIGPFRDGTADHGDALWQAVETRIEGTASTVEAMSMMVHPDSLPVDFDDPIDGWIAMAVCNVTDPDARFGLDVLSTYAGFIAWDVEGHGEVEIAFPTAMEVEVTEFLEGREISSAVLQVSDAAPLRLDAVSRWERWRFW
ncbi:MAG: hypothetical protein AAF618_05145 [Pseudomonadota bacterium]